MCSDKRPMFGHYDTDPWYQDTWSYEDFMCVKPCPEHSKLTRLFVGYGTRQLWHTPYSITATHDTTTTATNIILTTSTCASTQVH